VQDYARCPRLFKIRWIDGIHGEESFESIIGRIFHDWAANIMMTENPPLDYALCDGMMPELRDMCRWFISIENKRYEILEEIGKASLWRPVKVEWEIHGELDVGEDVIVDAYGHVDRLDRDEDGRYVLIEYKTTRSQHLTDWRRELTFYRLILEAAYGYEIKYYVVMNPMRQDYIVERPSRYSEIALKKLLVRLAYDTEFKPRRGEHCWFCPVRKICEEE